MKRTFLVTIIMLTPAVLLTSCAFLNKKPKIPEDAPTKKGYKREIKAIGRIASINEVEKFVLIKVGNKEAAGKHTTYYVETRSNNAVLTPTGEQVGDFLAADITSGSANVHDAVFVLVKFSESDEGSGTPLTPLSEPSPFLTTDEDTSTTPSAPASSSTTDPD